MKKVATITFHWATNYGAVLQAYALQKYLKKNNFQTEIINYIPIRVKILTIISNIRNKNYYEFKKERLIKKFREDELILSNKRYLTRSSLKKEKFDYDVVVCGSDQIWNKNFTMNLDGRPNLSYFLDFLSDKTEKVSYAVSFGANSMPDEYYKLVTPFANHFKAISVREENAIFLAEKMGQKAVVVCDPTLLLDRTDYEELLKGRKYSEEKVFSYILHTNQIIAQKVVEEVKKLCRDEMNNTKILGLYEWLYKIKNSKMVVTNSFHGVMMSLIFNTPFIVVPVEGSDMNNRILTIMKVVKLEDRIVNRFDKEYIRKIFEKKIDWKQVNHALQEYSYTGKKFLMNNI